MMMSLFSSFDVLCAETFGQKVSLPWGSPEEDKKQQLVKDTKFVSSPSNDHVGINKGKNGISSSDGKISGGRKQRRPRFAVELDGVHCFESIVPY
ncbi:hypothetical protein Leryth_000215 [Lithospermum erythrorhizon]|uniref:Uncharacterized protein n=1 Tax=Lithospermum erythrorhizon TaxID=34254 RepID=A0AAV3S1J1_LITER|nr:hypothetical protein Leryth_000215 [Lithospermum erythrorhizon]